MRVRIWAVRESAGSADTQVQGKGADALLRADRVPDVRALEVLERDDDAKQGRVVFDALALGVGGPQADLLVEIHGDGGGSANATERKAVWPQRMEVVERWRPRAFEAGKLRMR